METFFSPQTIRRRSRFKSYYVVWKRFFFVGKKGKEKGFKSYYVVWKLLSYPHYVAARPSGLNRTMQYGNYLQLIPCGLVSKRFKSYYVVWKPGAIKNTINGQPRLNRTMQYGNIFKYLINITSVMFKSYYVVWKHDMQNNTATTKLLFKSYYVVWKLRGCERLNSGRYGLNRTMQYGNKRENTATPSRYIV